MNDFSRDETEVGAFGDPSGRQWGPLGPRAFGHGIYGTQGCVVAGYRDSGDFSRDETEVGAFEDPSGEADFAGFFDKLAKPFIGKAKKKVEADVRTQLAAKGATPAQLALVKQAQGKLTIKASDVARGMLTTAKIGAAVAAFVVPGGAVASAGILGGLAASEKVGKAISAGKQVASTVKGAQQAVGNVKAAVHGNAAQLGGLVAADHLVAAGERGVASAKATLQNTVKLAAAGNVQAQNGLQLIGMASSLRARSAVPKGAPQPVTAAGNAALVSFLANRQPVVVPRPLPASPYTAVRPPAAPVVPARAPAPVIPPRPVMAAAPVVRPPVLPARAPAPAPAAPPAIGWFVDDRGLVTRLRQGQVIASGHGGWRVSTGAVQRFFG